MTDTVVVLTSTSASSQTWAVPPECPVGTNLTIEAWGAGSGGSGANTSNRAGGAGGAYATSLYLVTPHDVSNGVSFTLNTGSSGTGAGNSTAGTDTSWSTNNLNVITDTRNTSANVGTNTLPPNWAILSGSNAALSTIGLTSTIQSFGMDGQTGLPYLSLNVSGTITGTSFRLFFENNTGAVTAGASWTTSVYAMLTGSGVNSVNLSNDDFNVNTYLSTGSNAVSLSSTAYARVSSTHTTPATTTRENCYLEFFCTNGASVNVTLMVGAGQTEAGASATFWKSTPGYTLAKGGGATSGTTGGVGGAAASCIPTTGAFSGGNGATRTQGGGGGGSAGHAGAGTSATTGTGGTADNGTVGAGVSNVEGGGGATAGTSPSAGGSPGGGGGANTSTGNGSAGGRGQIRITFTPVPVLSWRGQIADLPQTPLPRAFQASGAIFVQAPAPPLSIGWQNDFRQPYLVATMPTAAVPTETHPTLPPPLGIIGWYEPLSTPPAYLSPWKLPVAVSSPAFFPGFIPIIPPAPAFSYYLPFGNPPPPLPNRATYMPPATGPPPNYAFDRWFQEALSEPPAYLARPALSTAIQQTFTAPITAALPAAPLVSNIHPGLPAWAAGTYTLGKRFSSGGNAYQCIQAGTSTLAPVGTGSFIQMVPADDFSFEYTSDYGTPPDTAAFKWLSHIDYTSLQAWAYDIMTAYSGSGLPAGGVTALNWNDTTLTAPINTQFFSYFGIPSNGAPTLITTAPGESFRDSSGNQLTFNAANGVAFDAPTSGAELNASLYCFIDVANVTIDGFQFRNLNPTGQSGANTGGNANILIGCSTHASNLTIQNCILDGCSLFYINATNVWLKNCLLINEQVAQASSGTPLWPVKWDTGATGGAVNCTCIGFNPAGTCSMFTTIGSALPQAQIINTAAFGIPNPFFCQNTGGSITVDHSATNLPSVTADGATSGALTNVFGNTALSGASPGSPGILPTGFDATTQANGLAFQVVNNGTDVSTGNTFVDLRMHGTGNGSDCNIYLSGLGGTATGASTTVELSVNLAIVGGSTANLAGIALTSNNLDSGGGFISGALFSSVSLTGALQSFAPPGFATTPTTAFNSFGIDLETPTNGQPVDITLRIEVPQLFIPSGGANVVGLSAGNQFLNTTNDFRLKPVSGLIDRARADITDLPSRQDIYRTIRPQGLGWDIGAFEFVFSLVWLSALPQPVPPSGALPVALRSPEPPFISIQTRETTTLDRYFQHLSKPVWPLTGLAKHLQQALTEPTAQFFETTTVSRWLPSYPAFARGLILHPALMPSEVAPVTTTFAADITRFRWFSNYPNFIFGLRLPTADIPFSTFQPTSPLVREPTTVDRWFEALSVPQLWRTFLREHAPSFGNGFVPIHAVPVALTVLPTVGMVLVQGYSPPITRKTPTWHA